MLLYAFAQLGAPYHLLLIGGDRFARPNSNVTMIPYRRDSQELAQWIASCDALVHAGTKETFGLGAARSDGVRAARDRGARQRRAGDRG